ncbi:MAG: hypothetical protein ACXACD_22530 [Candidatus Thorarchaeota archaeon]
MISEEDSKYPRYGLYRDPKSSTEIVCQWCGNQEVKKLHGGLVCSHKCHAAMHLKVLKELRLFGMVVLILVAYLLIFHDLDFLVFSLLMLTEILMFVIFIYSAWAVRVGNIMMKKTDTT